MDHMSVNAHASVHINLESTLAFSRQFAHLNPIESVWKQLNETVSLIVVGDEDEFHELVKNAFQQVAQRVSYTKK